jgi:phage terminase large subunit-like protein
MTQSTYFNPKTHPFCFSGYQYALDVVAGKIPNCIYIIGACKRFLKDLESSKYPFDSDIAERYLRLVQKFKHVKGNWQTEHIKYEPWQNFIFMNIIGFQNPNTGFRRFRTAHIEVCRGQGKSVLASQAGLYFLSLDNPKGNEISCFAKKSEQARIVLDSARAMAQENVKYRNVTGTKVLAHKIVHPKSNSTMRAMSSDSKSADGLNDILSIIDELHVVDRSLFDVISSGLSKRQDSLLMAITTAGFDVDGVGFSQSVYAKKVATGEIIDDQFFSAVYTIDKNDDIYDPLAWKKANPNFGVSVDPITFAAKAEKTKATPADLPNFKTKHLNVWESSAQQFYDLSKWDECFEHDLSIDKFRGLSCKVGIDLASKVDLTAKVLLFKKDDLYYVFDTSYLPEEALKNTTNDLYAKARETGHLAITTGEAIHYPMIEEAILADSKQHKIQELFYDPWQATQMAQNLMNKRINVVEFRFNTSNLSEPTKTLDALIRQKKIRHNGSPILRFCLGNIVAKEDAAGNVYPKKQANSEHLKIDTAIALIMALAGYIQDEKKDLVYNRENRGIRFL